MESLPHNQAPPVVARGIKEWRATFDAVQHPVMILDPTFRILQANQATASFLDMSLDRIAGSICHHLFHHTDGCVLGCPAAKAANTRRHEEAEVYIDDKKAWLHVSADPLQDAAGNLVGLVHTVRDITESKSAQIALAESQAQLLALVESTTDMVWYVDPKTYGLQMFNTGLKNYFRTFHNLDLRVGMTPEQLLPKDVAVRWHEFYSRTLREGSLVTEYATAAGTFSLLLSFSLLRRGNEVFGISVFGKDITALRKSMAEVERLKRQVERENAYLREQVRVGQGHRLVAGQSKAIQHALAQVEQVAPTNSTVLLLGETGAGKELLALSIHDASPRRSHTMVSVNCAVMPAALVESELFGREKGAFTGALSRQVVRFELANESTIFLDEVAELPPEVQAKLLRVLEARQIERLGNPKPIPVDVRIIAATNRNLEEAVRQGKFRQDLYYRLNVFPITVPPLRERPEDIPVLVWAFVEDFTKTFNKNIQSIERESMEALQHYSWPGNVRELRNVVERAMIVATGPMLRIQLPASSSLPAPATARTMEQVEREHMLCVLKESGWRIRGPSGAAGKLGLKPTTLEARMRKLGVQRPSLAAGGNSPH